MRSAGIQDRPQPFLMAGFEGKSLPPRTRERLRDGSIGGVVLFSRNVEEPAQVRELCREIRAAAGSRPPPLVAIDQEGGRVRRLLSPAFTSFPPARACALFGDAAEDVAERMGAAMATELRALGVDVNFAPVLDVDSNPRNPVIGDRAFSDRPDEAARLGTAFLRGSLSAGVVPVGKHFPGHGNTESDSHFELPVVRDDRGTVLARDVLPFRLAARAGMPAVMTAHVLYPALDPGFPATLSVPILTGLLRTAIRFRGVVFSDALEMKAIVGRWGMGEAAVRALSAGCDAVLVCRGDDLVEEAADALAREACGSAGFRRRIAESARRIRALRETPSGPGLPPRSLRSVGSRRHRELARLLAERWESTGHTFAAGRSGNIGEG